LRLGLCASLVKQRLGSRYQLGSVKSRPAIVATGRQLLEMAPVDVGSSRTAQIRPRTTDWKNVYIREASTKEQFQGVVPVTQFGQMCAPNPLFCSTLLNSGAPRKKH